MGRRSDELDLALNQLDRFLGASGLNFAGPTRGSDLNAPPPRRPEDPMMLSIMPPQALGASPRPVLQRQGTS